MPVRLGKRRRFDTVTYRNASGQTMNTTVLADQKAPTATPGSSTSTTGGTLAAATYSYRVAWVYGTLISAPSPAKTQVTTGSTSTVTIDVSAMGIPQGATGFRVYGRTGGSELLMGTTVSLPTTQFIDDGSLTPAGALPTDTGALNLKQDTGMANLSNIAKASSYKQTNVYYLR